MTWVYACGMVDSAVGCRSHAEAVNTTGGVVLGFN